MIPGLAIVLLIAIAAALLWSSTKRPSVEHVSCAQCLYSVEFAPARHCQECGGDLTEVGVLTPAMGKTAKLPWRTVAALGLSLVPAFVAGGFVGVIVSLFLPPLSIGDRRQHLSAPSSGAYQGVEVSISTRRRGDVVRVDKLCLRVEFNDNTWSQPRCFPIANRVFVRTMETETHQTGKSTMTVTKSLVPKSGDPPGRYYFIEPSDVPLEELISWADRIGLDTDDPVIRGELQDVVRVITEGFHTRGATLLPLDHFAAPSSSSSSRSQQSSIPGWTMFGVAALVWLALARSTLRRARSEREKWRDAAKAWVAETS